jgi:hypothetical protein
MADGEQGSEAHPMSSLPPPPLPPPPTAPPDQRSSRSTIAAGALGLTAGLAAWAMLGAYNENLAGFFGACLLIAGAYGAIAPRTAVPFGIGLVVGVTPLSMFTAHQGDGDGLWVLVIPTVAGFGLLTAGTAAVAATVIAPRIRSEDAVSRFVGDHAVLVCVPCVLLSVALVPITVSSKRCSTRHHLPIRSPIKGHPGSARPFRSEVGHRRSSGSCRPRCPQPRRARRFATFSSLGSTAPSTTGR